MNPCNVVASGNRNPDRFYQRPGGGAVGRYRIHDTDDDGDRRHECLESNGNGQLAAGQRDGYTGKHRRHPSGTVPVGVHMKKHEGFTLVEILVSMFVGMLIIGAIYAAVVSSQRSTASVEQKVVAGQDARAALELMAIEIQMASYNPTYATGMWANPASCTAVSANQNYCGIQAATDSSITVEADINDNGSVVRSGAPNINPNEIITYTYDAANQYITRETRRAAGISLFWETPRRAADRARSASSTPPRFPSSGTSTPRGSKYLPGDCRQASRTSPGSISPCGWRRSTLM